MRDDERDASGPGAPQGDVAGPARWLGYCLILGLYLTLRGYHSLDGDQAYRLPLLLRLQDPALYVADPFVRAFDAFNPHRGALHTISLVSSGIGLSPGLLLLFVLTFLGTCLGVDRLARAVWPGLRNRVGWVAIVLVLAAKAGNIGTNHLFEAMVLDRLMALAVGWLALAAIVSEPGRGWRLAAIGLGLAALIHPSLGLQLALVVAGSWVAWAVLGGQTGVSSSMSARGIAAVSLAVMPGLILNLVPGGSLQEGLAPADFWTIAVELQSPQHMLPHLWRMPQWLAWGCYIVLAVTALLGALDRFADPMHRARPSPSLPPLHKGGENPCPARVRLTVMLAVVLLGLGAAWGAIEGLHDVRITVFQPFRLATLARGLALVLIAGRLVDLWDRGTWLARLRSVLLGVALAGDWLLVVVTLAEAGTTAAELVTRRGAILVFSLLTAWSLYFLSRHDTESGHWPILLVLLGGVAWAGFQAWSGRTPRPVAPERAILGFRWALALAWTVPSLALIAGALPSDHWAARTSMVKGLVARCRFASVPIDDIERLALWCRQHTPLSARFIGPPGPKTFRLWSHRSLAFSRAGSPYHAAGLADWFARFQDHVDLHVAPETFVREYVSGRHRLEARYDALTLDQKAALAFRQGADHVFASAPDDPATDPGLTPRADTSLELLHTEGRYAVYRVCPELLSQGLRHRQQ